MTSGFTKRQHFVPRMLLRNFRTRGSDSIWVYDKRVGKVRRQSLNNSAVERLFYEHDQLRSHGVSLEEDFGRLEGEAAPIYRKILTEQSLSSVSACDREVVLDFVIVQLFRTQSARVFAKMGSELLFGEAISDEHAKTMALTALTRDLFRFRIWISTHIVSCRQIPRAGPRFVVGDHPVSIWREGAHEAIVPLPDALRRATIALPLDPRHALFLFPPHREAELLRDACCWYRPEIRVLDEMQPCAPGDVEAIVMQQVLDANRFVFASTRDMDDVEKITRLHQGCHQGPWRVPSQDNSRLDE